MASQPEPSSRPPVDSSRPSRQPSIRSVASDVFSDEHAYSDGETIGDETSEHVDPFRSDSPDDADVNIGTANSRPSLADAFPRNEQGSSTSNRAGPSGSGSTQPPLTHPSIIAAATQCDAATLRTLSMSSRFSIPRPQSPYRGPTAPSQPYSLYPQMERVSSIASDSTFRPSEQPFVGQGGPEHPYAMYQNTVPEEADSASGDEDDGSQRLRAVPLGFASGPSTFGNRSTTSGNDTGDIVGSDGHVEQLPPYSRFADNVIAKGDMASIDAPSTTLVDTSASPSERTPSTHDDEADAAAEPAAEPAEPSQDIEMDDVAREPTEEEDEQAAARKEGWLAKSKKRRYCGLPLLTLIILSFAIFAAAALGGIVGGVIGTQKSTYHAIGSNSATTTVWIDANPVSTGTGTPTCPTGHYTIPVTNTIKIGSCVVDQSQLSDTWDCMNQSYLGISVFDNGPSQPYEVAFDDYSVLPKLFQYGPQPPDFNGTSFTLSPAQDKDDGQLGVALFFTHLFDKLIILESDALNSSDKRKRSVPAGDIRRRSQLVRRGTYLSVADKPWYCFWNSTVEEFYIFLDQDITSSSSTSTSTSSGTTSALFASSASPTGSIYNQGHIPSPGTTTTSSSSAITTPLPGPSPPPPPPPPPLSKRSPQYANSNSQNNFPKLIKMVEKRKPVGNVNPYCQQMQVLDDWQIVPIDGIPTIAVEESDYAQPTGSSRSRRRWLLSPREDTVQELESNCVCEYYSSPQVASD